MDGTKATKTEESGGKSGLGSGYISAPTPDPRHLWKPPGGASSLSSPPLLSPSRGFCEATLSARTAPTTFGYTWPSVTSGPVQARGPRSRRTGEGEALDEAARGAAGRGGCRGHPGVMGAQAQMVPARPGSAAAERHRGREGGAGDLVPEGVESAGSSLPTPISTGRQGWGCGALGEEVKLTMTMGGTTTVISPLGLRAGLLRAPDPTRGCLARRPHGTSRRRRRVGPSHRQGH